VLRDERGRTVILRGYNIKVNGLFDVTPDNGQPVRETIPPLDDTDLTLMQKSGVNVLRLPVNWSAFEPQPGVFVSSYLDAITAFLDLVRPYGFYVLLDFHEDGWSKDLCEDGAPAWATVISPGQYEGGAPGGGLPCVERGSQRPFELFRPRREQSAVRGQFLVALRAPRVRRIHGDERLHWHAMGLVPLGSAPPGAATQS
jgi:hypothetical protein